MGIDLTYKAGEKEFCIRLSMSDWQTIAEVNRHLPAAVATCFEVPDFGQPAVIPRATLRDSAAQIETLLVEHPELLPHTYQYKLEFMQQGDKRIVLPFNFDTGGVSGVRLPGDDQHWYSILAGLNKLLLEKRTTNEVVEVRDLRGESELSTANMGCIQFRKRRAKTNLRKCLGEILAFLNTIDECQVTKVLG